ncbi:hypothetical protein BIW11_08203 [Tropilaelaps mercedesae]|uniref:SAM domain-containing protein n=1 Tax=Tropilaelaps mercedesae TaxID=418985 RepID=A0A1V9XQS9_9ACAR|nr:hypothetical protein BIW11_08203 [Tropilaelaps mercedesae]
MPLRSFLASSTSKRNDYDRDSQPVPPLSRRKIGRARFTRAQLHTNISHGTCRAGPNYSPGGGPLYTEQITVCENHRGYAASLDALYRTSTGVSEREENVGLPSTSTACGSSGLSAAVFRRSEARQLDKLSRHSLTTEGHDASQSNVAGLNTPGERTVPVGPGRGYPTLCERHRQERRHSLLVHSNHDVMSRYSPPVTRQAFDDTSRYDVPKPCLPENTDGCSTLPRSYQPAPRRVTDLANVDTVHNLRRFGSVDHVDKHSPQPVQQESVYHQHVKSHSHHRKPHDSPLVIPTPPPLPNWTVHRLEKHKSIDSWSQTSNTSSRASHASHESALARQMSILSQGSHSSHESLSSLLAHRRSSDLDSVSTLTDTNISSSQEAATLNQATGSNNTVTRGSIREEYRNTGSSTFSAMNELNEELQTKLTLLRGQREQSEQTQASSTRETSRDLRGILGNSVAEKIPRRRKPTPSAIYTYITPESNPQEVRDWMIDKGFEPAIVEACRGRTGEQMFSLTRDELSGHPWAPREEVQKLISHLTVQKNLCGYNPNDGGLKELLRRRKNLVDGGGTSDELMSPEGDLSHSASELQLKEMEAKDDQMIRARCGPTPPLRPRGHIVYTSSKDDTISLHSKDSEELIDESVRNSPTSVSSSFAFNLQGTMKSVLDSKESVDAPEATFKDKQAKESTDKTVDVPSITKETSASENGKTPQIWIEEIRDVKAKIRKDNEVSPIELRIEDDDREETRM